MSIVRWTPMFPALEEFDKLFDDFSPMNRMANFVPALDVYQTKDEVVVEAPLAGTDPAKINISIVQRIGKAL